MLPAHLIFAALFFALDPSETETAQIEAASKTWKGSSYCSSSLAQGPEQRQQIKTDKGSIFMEEVEEKRAPRRIAAPQVEFESLSVPVDEKGRIVPIIQGGSRQLRNYSQLELEYQPATIFVPQYGFAYPGAFNYGPGPQIPFGLPFYRPVYSGALAVPLGTPAYFFSSSEKPETSEQNWRLSGKYWNAPAGASVWSPHWRSPFAFEMMQPSSTEFEIKGSVRSIFPDRLSPND